MTERNPAAGAERSPDQVAVDVAVRLGFLGLFAWLSLSLVAPFTLVILWAVILAVAVWPVHSWLSGHFGERPKLTAFLLTLLGLAMVLGPAAVLAVNVVDTVESVGSRVADGTLEVPAPADWVLDIPIIGAKLHEIWAQMATNLTDVIERFSDQLLSVGSILLGSLAGLFGGLAGFALSVIIAGVMLVSGPQVVSAMRSFSVRIVGAKGSGFVDMAGATIRNVAQGVIGITLIQSLLLGIGMYVAGVPSAGLLALIAAVLGILQIGPTPVSLFAIVWGWMSLGTLPALLLTLYMVPATLMDNVLKPVLMSKGLPTPMLVILVGVIGGAFSYGLIGLFLGPVVLAVFYELLVAWVRSDPQEPDGV